MARRRPYPGPHPCTHPRSQSTELQRDVQIGSSSPPDSSLDPLDEFITRFCRISGEKCRYQGSNVSGKGPKLRCAEVRTLYFELANALSIAFVISGSSGLTF